MQRVITAERSAEMLPVVGASSTNWIKEGWGRARFMGKALVLMQENSI
ncbi:Hypothetical protein Cul210932_0547 [Corynebacterium ulcerans]|nr:Hypothetical protein Cul210932_0547 [Corynebacterium ulcerans]ALD94278.1 Hypothetical protein Cul131001_0553 [Corynebacterium ulcerans]